MQLPNILPVEDIVYANPCKTRNFIKHAMGNDVTLMTFDSADELRKIASVAPTARY